MSNLPQKSPSELHGQEIIDYLNSGRYISSMTRKMLEENLEKGKRMDKYTDTNSRSRSSLNHNNDYKSNHTGSNYSRTNKPENVKKPIASKKIKHEEFPTLGIKSIEPIESIKPAKVLVEPIRQVSLFSIREKIKPVEPVKVIVPIKPIKPIKPIAEPDSQSISAMNYSFLTSDTEHKPNIEENKLFVDDKLMISFTNIMEIYDYFTIYRIRSHYLELNQKMHLLESIACLNKFKGVEFKKFFGYNKMIEQVDNYTTCISIYQVLDQISYYLEVTHELILECQSKIDNDEAIKCDHIRKLVVATKKECRDITSISNMVDTQFTIYQPEINKYLEYIYQTVNNVLNLNKNNINTIISESIAYMTSIKNLINKIIAPYDPPFYEPIYCVLINKSTKNPLIAVGIKTPLIYLDCGEKIDLSTKNTSMLDIELQNLTMVDLDNIFKNKNTELYDNNIWIRTPNLKINIAYHIDDFEIPVHRANIEILGLPSNCSVFATTLTNQKLDNIKIPTYIPTPNISELWLCSRMRQPQCLLIDDYEKLDQSLKKSYLISDTDRNIFHIDYLFNELLQADGKNILIRPNMIDSFEKLAKISSL